MAKHAFISHASKDKEIAKKICDMLENRGIECWLAPRDIIPGRDYGEEIIRGIEETAATVLLMSENANDSTFVKKEIERAISKAKPVLPVRIRDVSPSPGLELFVSSAHWIDAWQSPIDNKIDQLANSIKPLIGQQTIKSTATPSHQAPQRKDKNTKIIALVLLVFVAAGSAFFFANPNKQTEVSTNSTANVALQPVANSTPKAIAPAVPAVAPPGANNSSPVFTTSRDLRAGTAIQSSVPQPNNAITKQPVDESSFDVAGTWVGEYVCGQGRTGLTLRLSVEGNSRVSGTFEFYPTAANRGAAKGSYKLAGILTLNSIVMEGQSWIEQPYGYTMVGINGRLAGISTIEGRITDPGCTLFSVTKR